MKAIIFLFILSIIFMIFSIIKINEHQDILNELEIYSSQRDSEFSKFDNFKNMTIEQASKNLIVAFDSLGKDRAAQSIRIQYEIFKEYGQFRKEMMQEVANNKIAVSELSNFIDTLKWCFYSMLVFNVFLFFIIAHKYKSLWSKSSNR